MVANPLQERGQPKIGFPKYISARMQPIDQTSDLVVNFSYSQINSGAKKNLCMSTGYGNTFGSSISTCLDEFMNYYQKMKMMKAQNKKKLT